MKKTLTNANAFMFAKQCEYRLVQEKMLDKVIIKITSLNAYTF